MKKSVKIVLFVIIVALLGSALYFLNADKNTNKNTVLLQLPEEIVTQISFKSIYSQKEAVIVKDQENGLWKCEDAYLKDVFKNDIFNTIANLRIKTEIKNPDNLSQYGFDEPRVVVNIKTTNGDYEIIIGGYNALEKAYYFKVSGSDSVYVTEEGSKLNYAFDYEADAFIQAQKK